MKVKTIYTPTDQSGAAFSFATNLYARFEIHPTTGVLSITTEK